MHIHGSNGASVGVETDRGATFIAGMSAIAEPPLNDLWTIPGEEDLLAALPGRGPGPVSQRSTPRPTTTPSRSRTSSGPILEDRPPLVTGEDGRRVVALFPAIYQSNREGRSIKLE